MERYRKKRKEVNREEIDMYREKDVLQKQKKPGKELVG